MSLTNDAIYLEHVTNFVYSQKEFKSVLLPLPSELANRQDLRFTIDDPTDFQNLQELYGYHFANGEDIRKTIAFLDTQPQVKQAMFENIKKYSK